MKHKILKEIELKIICDEFIHYSVNICTIRKYIKKIIRKYDFKNGRVFVVGRIANRCVLIEIESNIFLVISLNKKIDVLEHKFWFLEDVISDYRTKNSAIVKICEENINRFMFPIIRLIVLYHKENFPYPRFALGVSDICGSIRDMAIGDVRLTDMQTDIGCDEIVKEIDMERPSILGFSVTFGQQDLLEYLLKEVANIPEYFPEIVVGGSLASLNERPLLKMYPNLMICGGYGENTFKEIIKYWYKLIEKRDIPGISFINELSNEVHTIVKDDWNEYGYPELDLLPIMLEKKGGVSLECSRGCMNACTFCPRKSKGQWHNINLENIEEIMPYISKIFEKYPNTRKKIFLVDEEFFGDWNEIQLEKRIDKIIQIFYKYDFKFETSARIRQIYNQDKDKKWHNQRINMISQLKNSGLEKCLFGIESGVDSILLRFNKNTSAEENTKGIRILSSIGIPFRATYITFDPLMTMDELLMSYVYQGRTDIILRKTDMPVENLYELISNDEYVMKNSIGIPLYSKIPYMLVSMECLFNSKYLDLAKKENLLLDINTAMGKYNCIYLDKRIGLMSYFSQLWIDKNFALDYFFKSMMKIKTYSISIKLETFRFQFKESAYNLLGMFLAFTLRRGDIVGNIDGMKFIGEIPQNIAIEEGYKRILLYQFEKLKKNLEISIKEVINFLEVDERNNLRSVYEKWLLKEWKLINN